VSRQGPRRLSNYWPATLAVQRACCGCEMGATANQRGAVMIQTDLQWVSQAVAGQLFGANIGVDSVCTDTRKLTPGCLFVALKGENFDAHELLDQAVNAGTAALLVQQRQTSPSLANVPHVVVSDTRYALGQ